MKRIVLAVAGAALVGLTACSNTAAPVAAPGNAPVPVSCRQQYQAWEQGPGKGVIAAVNAVSVADWPYRDRILSGRQICNRIGGVDLAAPEAIVQFIHAELVKTSSQLS